MSGIVEVSLLGKTPRMTATMTRAASATQYAIGDAFMNTETAANATPMTWDINAAWSALEAAQRPHNSLSGRITGGRAVVAAASGTVVLTALAIDLYLFRPSSAAIPFTAGAYPADNAAVTFTAAAMRECLGILRFANTGWVNNVGTNAAAGGFLYQGTAISVTNSRPYAPFNFYGLSAATIIGIPVMRDVWNPGNVAQQFDVALDVDLD